jgi:2-methylcitrate dehydratase PrpD
MRRSHGHPGAPVIAAVLAAAELNERCGKELLLAIIVGYEIFARLGEAINPSHLQRGFHPSGTVGAVAAAVAAATALEAEASQIANAIGLAGSVAGGLMEYAETGAMATYLITGNAARIGLESALLARSGFTGPLSILEGRKGMAKAMADDVTMDVVTNQLSHTHRICETYFKPYPSCRHSHSAIDAARQITGPGGINPSEIAGVEVRSYALAVDECDHPEFSTLAGADTSFQFTVASTLRFGNYGLRWRSLGALRDAATRSLASRIRVVHDPSFDDRLPIERPARVTVDLVNGQQLQAEVSVPRGEPENPLSQADLLAKAHEAADGVVGHEAIERLANLINAIEDQPVARLAEACCPMEETGVR